MPSADPGEDIEAFLKKYKNTDDDDNDPNAPFVDWPRFNIAIGVVIMVNAIFIGLELDSETQASGGISGRLFWYVVENIFCLIFLMELCARIYFHHFAYFRRLMNVVDFVLVVLAVIDTWILTPMSAGGNLRIFATLRVIRMLRLVRLIRLLRMFKELWLIVNGLIQSMKTLAWVSLLMVVTLYTGAIFTTMQVGQNDEVYNHYFEESGGWDHEIFFGTVPRSMFTLFQICTLDSWSEGVVRHVIRNQMSMAWFFIFFVIFATFGLLNLVVGVIVENTLAAARLNESKIKKQQDRDRMRVLNHLREIFEIADEDGNGTLTENEMRVAISNPEVANKLKLIDFPLHDPNEIFLLLDVDQSGELSIDEFIGGCMRLKGNARSKDLLAVQVAVETLGKRFSLLEEKMLLSGEKIGLLDSKTRHMMTQAEEVFLDPRELRRRQQEEEEGGLSHIYE